MTQPAFGDASTYDAMLERGLRLSGESKTFFTEGRLTRLRELLPGPDVARQILDFGCGTGDTSGPLLERFGAVRVVGLDTSTGAVEHARRHHVGDAREFHHVDAFVARDTFDLCYTNGTFHHIEPGERVAVLGRLRAMLRPGGLLAVFENNPWNPGTRLVMRRVPFDRGARMVTTRRMRRLLVEAHFEIVTPTLYLFVFPAPLGALRGTERFLERLPLGGQYLVLGRRPSG